MCGLNDNIINIYQKLGIKPQRWNPTPKDKSPQLRND